ncbi:MAG: hypothetical protein ACI9MC_000971, partial [Kiritimatiellia bacterium]
DGTLGRNASRSSVVSLTRGSISVKATNTGRGAVAVVSPAGVATGANGGFRVTIEVGATRTEAVASAITVLAQGAELDVPAGFGARTRNGQEPGDLVQLLPPGSRTPPDAGTRLRIPDFAWTNVDRALGYRVEFVNDEAFTRLVRRSFSRMGLVPSIGRSSASTGWVWRARPAKGVSCCSRGEQSRAALPTLQAAKTSRRQPANTPESPARTNPQRSVQVEGALARPRHAHLGVATQRSALGLV